MNLPVTLKYFKTSNINVCFFNCFFFFFFFFLFNFSLPGVVSDVVTEVSKQKH